MRGYRHSFGIKLPRFRFQLLFSNCVTLDVSLYRMKNPNPVVCMPSEAAYS